MANKKILSEVPNIHETARLMNSTMGKYCDLGAFSYMQNSSMDDYSYACSNCILQNADVGKFSNIAAYVRIGATDHPMERPTLHHFTYRRVQYGFDTKDDENFFEWRASRKAYIGHDTWIGHGSMIKPGVSIGNGAVIGQGAVVTKDIPAYAVAVGVPAKVIYYRFDEETIRKLESIKWWDWSHEKIKENFDDFTGNIQDFVKKHYKEV